MNGAKVISRRISYGQKKGDTYLHLEDPVHLLQEEDTSFLYSMNFCDERAVIGRNRLSAGPLLHRGSVL